MREKGVVDVVVIVVMIAVDHYFLFNVWNFNSSRPVVVVTVVVDLDKLNLVKLDKEPLK